MKFKSKKTIYFGSIVSAIVCTGFIYFHHSHSHLEHEHKASLVSHEHESPYKSMADSPRNSIVAPQNTEKVPDSIEIAGERIAVEFKKLEFPSFDLEPGQTPASIYPTLVERSLNGDATAARMLSQVLGICNTVHTQRADHDLAMNKLKTTNVYSTVDDVIVGSTMSKDKAEEFVQVLNQQFEYCEGLTSEQRGEGPKWAEMAAENGDLFAMRKMIQKADADVDSETQYKWLKRSWDEYGDAAAPGGISTMYEKGLIPNEDGDFVVDKKMAYAYLLVSLELEHIVMSSWFPDEYEHSNANIQSRYDEFLSLAGSNLSAQEQLDAEAAAIEIVKKNDSCCSIDTGEGINLSGNNQSN